MLSSTNLPLFYLFEKKLLLLDRIVTRSSRGGLDPHRSLAVKLDELKPSEFAGRVVLRYTGAICEAIVKLARLPDWERLFRRESRDGEAR